MAPTDARALDRTRLLALEQFSKQDCSCGTTPEIDAGECPQPPTCFPRFFPGQLVQPEDLQGIEQLFFAHEKLRARELIGWGIACGFRVGIDGLQVDPRPVGSLNGTVSLTGAQLRVEAGYGVDHYGRDVRMVQDATFSVEQLLADRLARIKQAMGDPWCTIPGCQPKPVEHYCIAVRYKECLEKPVPSYTKQCGPPKTVCDYSRVCESVEIRLFGEEELPPDEPPATRDTQSWCAQKTSPVARPDLVNAMRAAGISEVIVASAVAAAATPDACTGALGSIAHACAPCVDNPWLKLACFTISNGTVHDLDCKVRRAIWSMAEMQNVLSFVLCKLLPLIPRS